MTKYIYILILLLYSFSILAEEDADYGLFIKSFPSGDTEKTSLALENNAPLKVDKEMQMSFSIKVRKDNVLGIVFRMITDKKDNIDLSFTVGENNKRYPMLVINEAVYMITKEVVCDKWTQSKVVLSSEKNEITLEYDGNKITAPYKVSNINNVMVSFGLCPFQGYTLFDIASVNLRDIKIYNQNKLFRSWKLEKHNGVLSPDSIANVPAITTNPLWLTDAYASWNKIYSKQIKDNSLFAFDAESGIFYIASPDSKELHTFNVKTRTEDFIPVHSGVIAANAPNQLLFAGRNKGLISYNLDEDIISAFSFKKQCWENNSKPILEHGYWNNSVSYSAADSSIISFGGYGFYKYNNDLVRVFTNRQPMKKTNLPEISPRHSSATVVTGNTLYIFGGKGNKSGRQELSPKNYYDLYSVNLLTEQTNKLWELNSDSLPDFIPSDNMIQEGEYFYMFSTKNSGTLLRINKNKPGIDQMSYPIGEDFTSHYLYTNLYFSPSQKKFFVVINKMYTDKPAEVSLYSLNYPPVIINQTETNVVDKSEGIKPVWIYSLILLLTSIIGFVLFILVKKNKQKDKNKQNSTDQPPLASSQRTVSNSKPIATQETIQYDFSKQAICFLGGFNVTDRNGQDVTGLFTPTLKYLLIILILSTQKDKKGISAQKLIQLLWPGKNEESAKNNRNVYLSKLRSVMENIGTADIINENGFWTIQLHDDIVCDYNEAMVLFHQIRANGNSTEHINIDNLLRLLLKGVLLPNIETDWIDGYKSDFSNLTIDILTQLSRKQDDNLSDDMLLKVADTLFLHDYINEEALYLKCSIYFNSGKKGIAKTIYDNFCKEYLNLLGIPYKQTLAELLEKGHPQ